MILHDYWRSTASYRVRIALNLKGIEASRLTYDLREGKHRAADYIALNPQGLVPVVETEDGILMQSPAILEWLEERYAQPPLLPPDRRGRAIVRAMAAIICCDIHPVNNLRIIDRLRGQFGAGPAAVEQWIAHWIGQGFAALEAVVRDHGGQFAYGNVPGIADCCLVPQLFAAERFGVDLAPYPRLVAAGRQARALSAFAAAAPERQPDADRP